MLAWSDEMEPDPVPTGGLVNDLALSVESVRTGLLPTPLSYLGNNFNENIQNDDDGYSYAFANHYLLAQTSRPDHVNTVEAVFIPASAYDPLRVYEIEVIASSISDGPQDFSVFAYNLEPAP